MSPIRRSLGLVGLAAFALVAACTASEPVTPVVPAKAVSFKADVAPLLASKCSGCHVPGGRGSTAVAIFDANGDVAHANVAAAGSRIVAAVESGQMPMGRPRLSAEEVGVLARWVQDGAKND